MKSRLKKLPNEKFKSARFLQPPAKQREQIQTEQQFLSKQSEFEQCVQWLRKRGIHVNFRREIHEKLVVIDEHILWDGSKNVLSAGLSSERMNRFTQKQRIIDAIADHQLDECTDCLKLFRELGIGDLGEQLARIRLYRGKSQRSLALASGNHQKNISKIEKSLVPPRISKSFERLCAVLDSTVVLVPRWMIPSVCQLLAFAEAPSKESVSLSISFAPSANASSPMIRESSAPYSLLNQKNSVNISFSSSNQTEA